MRAALLTDAPLINQERTGGSPERGKSSFNLGNELHRFDSSPTSTRRDYSPMPGPLGTHRQADTASFFLPRTVANFGRNTLQPSLPPQELLTAQNSMGGPPQYPGSRLGGGYVAPENNISSALSMDLVGKGLAHRVT